MARKVKEEPEIEDLVVGIHGCAHSLSAHDMDMKRTQNVREGLLIWYDANRRKLPWRGDPPPFLSTATHTKKTNDAKKTKASAMMDAFVVRSAAVETEELKSEPSVEAAASAPPRKVSPYETWVSEIMLQQTRVDTVVDYFLKWTDKFPTVEALANGSEEDVNALWAGLGYYRRARMLHAGAKYVMENFNGKLPSSTEQLLTIPGIGPYTAGAISSIAFGNQEPLVDGNVIRVVARLRAVGADPKNKRLINFSWKTARELVEDCDRPGALNQALMELGATVCAVQNPLCASCPVRGSCLAYEEATNAQEKPPLKPVGGSACDLCDASRIEEWLGKSNRFEVTRYPLKAKKNESKNESICVAVVSHAEDVDESIHADKAWKFLMTKRPDGGLLAGQWEFIHSKVDDSDKILAYSQRKTHMKPRLADMFTSKTPLTASNKSLQRRDVGELVHVFSHVKHHMGIEHLHFETAPILAKAIAQDSSSVRWMTVDDMDQLGITTGVKKILQLVLKGCVATPPQSLKKTDAAKTSSKRTVNKQKPAPLKNTDQKDNGEDGPAVQVQKRRTGTARAHVTDTSLAGSAKRLKTIRSFFKK